MSLWISTCYHCYLCFHLLVCPSACQVILSSVLLSICLRPCRCVCLSVRLSVWFPNCFPIFLSICLRIILSTYAHVSLSGCPLVCLYHHLMVFVAQLVTRGVTDLQVFVQIPILLITVGCFTDYCIPCMSRPCACNAECKQTHSECKRPICFCVNI